MLHVERYIHICEVRVQALGQGKLRGDQLPPFQLPLPHSPLHLFRHNKQEPTHLKEHILGCRKVLPLPACPPALSPGTA